MSAARPPGAGAVPSPLAGVARCLALDAAAVAASAALRAGGIPSVLLKGPGTAHLLHPDRPGRRGYGDVDLLVPPAAFAAAQDLLAGLGYRSLVAGSRDDEWSWHERAWRIPGEVPLTLDLHRGFAGVRDADALWAAVSASAVPLPLAGAAVAVPGPACSALLLGLHAANPGPSPKPVADLERALDVLPAETWVQAAAVAATVGATSALAAGLGRVPAGAALAASLGLPTRLPPVEWLRAGRASPTGYALALLAAEPGLRARVRRVRRRLLPTPAFMRLCVPLSRRGRAGLLAAYGLRLARHGWGLPRGVREFAAARAQARPPGARRRPWPAAAGMVRRVRGVPAAGRTAVWAVRSVRSARRQLRSGSLDHLDLPAPPRGPASPVPVVLRLARASCLERCLVRQRWHAGRGVPRDLVVGVRAPGAGFRAHAWLDGDAAAGRADLVELFRRPPRAGWLTGPGGISGAGPGR